MATSDDTLDLAEIDPPVWYVQVEGSAYGPYTLGQIRSFADEERIDAETPICGDASMVFKPAAGFETLAALWPQSDVDTAEPEPAAANFLLTLKAIADSRTRIIDVLNEAGTFAELMPGTFVLNSALSLPDLRARLFEVSDAGDRLVLVNASTGRLAWYGLGTQTDTHVRSVWTTAPRSSSKS